MKAFKIVSNLISKRGKVPFILFDIKLRTASTEYAAQCILIMTSRKVFLWVIGEVGSSQSIDRMLINLI